MTAVSDLEETLLELCSISSFTGEEGPLCDHVEARMVALLGREAVVRDGHSLVAFPSVATDGPDVVLAGHLDVVRTSHDGPPRIEGERLYGPGAADMKSGLVIMLDIAEQLCTRAPRVRPVFVFYEREEGPYVENRLGDLLDRLERLRRASFAVCLEPSSNVLQLGCMGSLHGRVTFRGRTSHSARPWQGDNAIQRAGGLLSRLAARQPRDVILDDLLYREVMSATMASGGRGRNVVPDAFEINVNVRFAPGRTSQDAERELNDVVAGEAEVEIVDRSPSAPPNRAHPMIAALQRAGVEQIEPKQAWTDVARFAACGVPAVNLGPGTQAQAHQRNEWTDRAALQVGREMFRRWVFG